MTETRSADELLTQVHERLGGVGVDILTFGGDGTVEVRWRRSYDGVLSDERFASAGTLVDALAQVLAHEDVADADEALELSLEHAQA